MKKLTYILPFIFVVLVLFTACKKSGKVQPPATVSVTGTWLLVAQRGGLTGGYIPMPAIPRAFTFNADSTYLYVPGQLSGTYHITQQKSIFTGAMEPYIIMSQGSTTSGGLIVTQKDTMVITDNHVEPISSIFARVYQK
ncbi:MAG: hypothetical protein V4592_06170 [Bacteroidota bacterium]